MSFVPFVDHAERDVREQRGEDSTLRCTSIGAKKLIFAQYAGFEESHDERVEDFAQRVRKGLEALSWEERRTIVRTLIARIEIADDDVTIVYRVPTSSPTGSPTTAPTGSSNARPRAAPTVSSSAPTAPTVPAASGIVDCVQGVSTSWKRAV